VSTDTIKNVVNVVARENTGLCSEEFCQVLAKKYLDTYAQVASVSVTAHETKWSRLSFGGKPHPHSFVLDSNGKPTVQVDVTRSGSSSIVSGIDGFAFMKSTQSGWAMYAKDPYTTIPETNDRMCATSMVATWTWSNKPASYPDANRKILDTLLDVFSNTYSYSVQDSLYRMGEAALAAVPEISEVSMACPNMHFILMNLGPFGLDNKNQVFLPTDEPHGQIECTVGRN
jgi:urate oxidase